MHSKFLIDLTTDIVSAHAGNNTVAPTALPGLIQAVYSALSGLGHPAAPEEAEALVPAVAIRSSVKAEAITCLECGLKLQTLKRHLLHAHNLAPADYRDRWNLKSDYPMIAPNYSAVRSGLAKKVGLGRKPAAAAPAATRARKTPAKK